MIETFTPLDQEHLKHPRPGDLWLDGGDLAVAVADADADLVMIHRCYPGQRGALPVVDTDTVEFMSQSTFVRLVQQPGSHVTPHAFSSWSPDYAH